MLKNLLKLIFPKLCCGCNNLLLQNENSICASCRHSIPLTNHHLIANNNVTKKFYGLIDLEFGSSMLYFHKGGIVQKMIHNLKYRGNEKIGVVLGEWYANELKNNPIINSVTEIIPVPLHKKRLNERGYNQVDSFCKALSKELNIPFNNNLLKRKKYSKTQTTKNKIERQLYSASVFDVSFSERDENKHFLLIDDVITTGSTLELCAKALLKIPNTKVSIVTIAFTDS